MTEIPDPASLRAHVGQVSALAARKVMPAIDRHARAFIGLSPFIVLATADAEGRVDASPRGDPAGFVRVLDERTLLLPDRPGNNRVDSFLNVVSGGGVGLIFFVPGIDETLRVNGSARMTADPALLADCAVGGKQPKTGVVVTVAECFFHCAKALKRAHLWDASNQVDRSSFPSLGRILADQLADVDAAAAEERVERSYRETLY